MLLADGLRRVQAALVPALVLPVVLAANRSAVAIFVALVLAGVTVALGNGGIDRIGRVVRLDAGLASWGRIALAVPLVGIGVLLMLLAQSRGAAQVDRQAEAERALERARQRTARREARAAPKEQTRQADVPTPVRPAAAVAAPTTRTPLECCAAALPSIKAVGLDPGANVDTVQVQLVGGGTQIPADDQPVLWVTPDGFLLVYLVDEGEHFRYLTRSELRKAGMAAADLHRAALRNLTALVNSDRPGLKIARLGNHQGLVIGGNFEASLLLVDALWESSFSEQAPNGAVVAIPARDLCIFCDARAGQAIAELRAHARQFFTTGDHPITDRLFVRRDGRWQELKEGETASGDLPPLDFTS